MGSEQRIFITDAKNAPKAVGPYSQAVVCGDCIYLSGQIPLNPVTGILVQGSIEEQTTQVMKNLAAVLEAAGATFSDVVKTTIFMTDLTNFKRVNEVYAAALGGHRPARATVGVSALPLGADVEIEMIAKK